MRGTVLAAALAGRREGDDVHFDPPLEVAEMEFTHACILRDYRTGSQARLLEMQPGGRLFICKFGDLSQESALMCAVRQMNCRWQQYELTVCGVPVEAITYRIIPLDAQVGLVEAVPDSKTMCDLGQECQRGERQHRVLRDLHEDPKRLDRLAATTVGYLTMCYALGIRDGHDDNLMLRSDGAFFRIDFGFAFGKTPEIDAPAIFVPRAVAVALGERRWAEVVQVCIPALQVLSGDDIRTLSLAPANSVASLASVSSQPPAWDLLRCVPEMGMLLREARGHVNKLSFDAFHKELQQADSWSLARATKNSLREAMRYLGVNRSDVTGPKDWLSSLGLLEASPQMPGHRDLFRKLGSAPANCEGL